jgi:hypothetical protein
MKRWLSLAWVVLGVCGLLALGRPEVGEGVDGHVWFAGRGRCVDTSAPPADAPATNCAPRQAPPALSASLAVDLMLWTEPKGPPLWLETRGPPGNGDGTRVDSLAAGKTGSPRQGGVWVRTHAAGLSPRPRAGFATPFS